MRAIDKLIRNMLKYSARPEWQGLFDEVLAEHVETAAEDLDMDREELAELMIETGWNTALLGVVFEDFIRIPNPEMDDRTFAETYLKRAGWREPARARKYLETLANSPMSLYEVVEVRRDRGLVLRDLLNAGQPFFVREKAATHSLAAWDILAARVVKDLDERVLGGGILSLEREGALKITDALAPMLSRLDDSEAAAFAETIPTMVTTLWLAQRVAHHMQPLPELVTGEGDDMLFGEARLPLHATGEVVAERLDKAPDWPNAGEGTLIWNWVWQDSASQPSDGDDVRMETFGEGGRLHGSVELLDDHLLFFASSRQRMEAGLARLAELLGDTVGQPLTSYQTPEQALAQRQGENAAPPPPDIPPEELAAIEHQIMDQHYRETLESPIPALGDKTPRQALRSKTGRRKVIEWLKMLENNEARRAQQTGKPAYDANWMWRELGLEDERY